MTKPDDIPQDVWGAAVEADNAFIQFRAKSRMEGIARAIMAAKAEEREASAQFMNDRAEVLRSTGSATALTVSNIYDQEAAAIRNRGAA